jgi:hypothetical protein
VLQDCVRHLVDHCGMQPGQLGVITPYAAQVSLISRGLQASGFNINGSGGSSWDSMHGEQVQWAVGCNVCDTDWQLMYAAALNDINIHLVRLPTHTSAIQGLNTEDVVVCVGPARRCAQCCALQVQTEAQTAVTWSQSRDLDAACTLMPRHDEVHISRVRLSSDAMVLQTSILPQTWK